MLSDLRDAFRALGRDRSFTLLSVLLFALTIGATTAVYAVVEAVLLRPMAFGHQDRTVVIWERDDTRGTPVVEVAIGEVETWNLHAASFDGLAVFGSVNWPITLIEGDSRTRASYASVSSPFFDIVGVPPALGRVFDPRDETGNEPRVAVISDGFWKRHFGSDPLVVGRSVRVQRGFGPAQQERTLEVVGVMPAGFDFPRDAELWLPAAPEIRAVARPDPTDPAAVAWYLAHFKVFYGLGRLQGGTTAAQAREELGGIIRSTEQSSPTGAPTGAVVTLVDDYLVGPAKPVLWTMLRG